MVIQKMKLTKRRSGTAAKVNSSENFNSVENEAGKELVEEGTHRNIVRNITSALKEEARNSTPDGIF